MYVSLFLDSCYVTGRNKPFIWSRKKKKKKASPIVSSSRNMFTSLYFHCYYLCCYQPELSRETERVCVCVCVKRFFLCFLKELAHMITETGESSICRVGWCHGSGLRLPAAEFPLTWRVSLFFSVLAVSLFRWAPLCIMEGNLFLKSPLIKF